MDYLWTPWRYQYMAETAAGKHPECIFCASAIISSKTPGSHK